MNADQKKRIAHEISNWKNACNCRAVQLTGDRMAALLQELADAPEVLPATNPSQISSSAEPFGYFKAEPFGWTDCAETDDGAIALYTAPPVSDVEPVAYVTGYNNGYPTIAPINSALCMAIGTALYSAPPAPSVPDGWIRAIDEAMVVHHIGIADRADSYEVAKKKLNALLAINSDIARDCSEPPADVARDVRLQVESEFAALLPGVTYMDEPDGGSPTVQEQIARMAMDAERYWWLLKQAWFQQAADRFDLPDGGLQNRFEKCMDEFIDAAIERQGGE